MLAWWQIAYSRIRSTWLWRLFIICLTNMEGILKYSALNPLATCFIPLNMKKTISEDTKKTSKIKDEDEMKLIAVNKKPTNPVRFKTEICLQNKNLESVYILVALSAILDSRQPTTIKLLNERIYFSGKCVDSNSAHSKYKLPLSTRWQIFDETVLKCLLQAMVGLGRRYDCSNTRALEWVDQTEIDSSESPETEKCDCPPMFGCIIPPDFFGNPFNLNSSCNKKCVHVCHFQAKESGSSTSECCMKTDLKDSKAKSQLGHNSWEFGSITAEDAEIFDLAIEDSSHSLKKINAKATKVQVGFRSDIDQCFSGKELNSIGSDCLGLDSVTEKVIQDPFPVIDSDFHPLLDGISMDNGKEEVLPILEKLATKAASPCKDKEPTFHSDLLQQTLCSPPCSVWCDSLPQPAKATYRNFINSLPQLEQDLWGFPKVVNNQRKEAMLRKPVYKKFSSTNNCVKQNINGFRSVAESNEFLARHQMRNYKYELSSSAAKERAYASQNENYSHKMLNRSHSNPIDKKTMWGLFDGEDSLWQELPECVPPFDKIPSSHVQKRGFFR